jgi:PIN domain nuclease of toxin-antitoxin system
VLQLEQAALSVDRMLAAQSELEDMPLITVDPAFESFPIQVLW